MKQRLAKLIGGGLVPLFGLAATSVLAAPPELGGPLPQDVDRTTRFDGNRIDMSLTNHGSFAYDIPNGDPGLIFPKGGQNTALFAAGLWVGAKVDGQIRVAVNEYSFECTPGKLNADGTWDTNYDTNERWRTYKIGEGDDATNNTDYADWPVEDGAPVDSVGNPMLFGNQTLWSVYHDADPEGHQNDAGNTDPLGMEVQQTTFGYGFGLLQNVVFLKFLFINKSNDTWEDTYVSVWSDPDLGGAADDFVGCDTTLSLGYCYNATNNDNQYGSAPPAIGFDFFQGPIVASEGDTAYVSGRAIPGFKNLPMTSFNKYINGTDPSSALNTYNYQSGLTREGDPVVNPITGEVTKFVHPDDPTASSQVGLWLDTDPADRRMMLSSGPFNMAPGDTQEVVTAIIVGQGADRLTSITALRFVDSFAQAAFDFNFDLPTPPSPPVVEVGQLDNEITLNWGNESQVEYDEPGYGFEGYNVYQYSGADGSNPTRVATYDVVNGVALIFDDTFDPNQGVVINSPVARGSDSGIQHYARISQDNILGKALRNGKEYYFGVTAYSYGPDAVGGLRMLESSATIHTVVPQKPTAGTDYADGDSGVTLESVANREGLDANVEPIVVDPSETTGDTYRVDFYEIPRVDFEHDPPETTMVSVWSLTDVTTNTVLLSDQENQSGDENYLVKHGILWKVTGALPGWKRNAKGNPMIDEIQYGDTTIEPDANGGPGNDVWHSYGSTAEFIFSAGGGDGGEGRFTRDGGDLGNLDSRDIYMIWDYADDNYGMWVFDGNELGVIPFKLIQRDPLTGEETRLLPFFFSGGGTPGVYDISADTPDGWQGWPATDWCYAYTGDWDAFAADAADGTIDDPDSHGETELFSRLVVASAEDTPVLPIEGSVYKFSTTKPQLPGDYFTIDTKGVVFDQAKLENDLDKIKVVPNPYRNQSTYELNQFNRRIKFTNLPPECTIRIFTLAGDLVKTLEKTDHSTSIMEWNLQTERSIPVASGIYLYHIEARNDGRAMGSTTGKIAIFMEKERLNFF
ncbi:MAG: hypothetical protein KDA27_08155 [Candidatus Eisenbacteria bacterium]|uniref:T9SS type A sorting domain-containing protein n=1 Tax=Eiseniibacteriota bacterium TaxID=2212470 RepID=A0A956NB85_UNCEI|nr:hypothetical protein [Candidatus Eisenbacteria bacterium]MCB9462668.1 hypothetical protein [Candidatus Eisenbacteria bacterium]